MRFFHVHSLTDYTNDDAVLEIASQGRHPRGGVPLTVFQAGAPASGHPPMQ